MKLKRIALLATLLAGGVSLTAFAAAEKLPFAVYSDDMTGAPWIASGYMGADPTSITMDDKCTDNPHTGKTCLKVTTKGGGWAGVDWQDPANDWGQQAGGHDLTGAKTLSFWARGDKGGEKVKFAFGGLKGDAKFKDTSDGDTGDVELTKDWKEYTIDLTGKDLSCIKTGFAWFTGADAVTFYLDDIEYK